MVRMEVLILAYIEKLKSLVRGQKEKYYTNFILVGSSPRPSFLAFGQVFGKSKVSFVALEELCRKLGGDQPLC